MFGDTKAEEVFFAADPETGKDVAGEAPTASGMGSGNVSLGEGHKGSSPGFKEEETSGRPADDRKVDEGEGPDLADVVGKLGQIMAKLDIEEEVVREVGEQLRSIRFLRRFSHATDDSDRSRVAQGLACWPFRSPVS